MSTAEFAGPKRRSRVVVCDADDLPPGQVRVVPLAKFGIGVYNVNGTYHALLNYCPHRGGPVCLGPRTGLITAGERPYASDWSRPGEVIRCPWHGTEFEIASGRSIVGPGTWAIRRYEVTVESGKVILQGV